MDSLLIVAVVLGVLDLFLLRYAYRERRARRRAEFMAKVLRGPLRTRLVKPGFGAAEPGR